jgi:UDP-N-acetylmuramoylalanine-D-glutamate ligase
MIALRGKNVLVVGMERSGIASAHLLAREGARVTGTDLRPLVEIPKAAEALDHLHAAFESQTDATFAGRDLIVISPGVPMDIPPLIDARARGIPVIGEVELASYFLKGRTIGITGSNGKTTTTACAGTFSGNAASRSRLAATSERRQPAWSRRPGRTSGTCWSCPVSNWRQSRISGPTSESAST